MALNLLTATAEEIGEALRTGVYSCSELTDFFIRRIEAYDRQGPALRAVITLCGDARDRAEALDRKRAAGEPLGALFGLPVILKDNIEYEVAPTTAGSKALEGSWPRRNAFLVQKLLDADAVILAKANLHEFAVWGDTVSGILGQTLNPYDLTRTPGGSSGGTGAAVAAGMALLGVGTDSVNSVRSPASACGLVGFRATTGLVSRSGLVPYSHTQDMAGPICRSVADTARMMDVMMGVDPADPATLPSAGQLQGSFAGQLTRGGLRGARLGVLTGLFGRRPEHTAVSALVRAAIDRMAAEGGAQLEVVDLPVDCADLTQNYSIHIHEFKEDLDGYLRGLDGTAKVHSFDELLQSGLYHPDIEENLLLANKLASDPADYHARLEKIDRLRAALLERMDALRLDALVFPHQQQLCSKVGAGQKDRNGVLSSILGWPSITLPAGYTAPDEDAPLGVPVGLEFVGRPWQDLRLFHLAFDWEQMNPARPLPAATPAL